MDSSLPTDIVTQTKKFLSVYLGIIYSHYVAEGKSLSEIVDICVSTNKEDFSQYTIGKTLIENKDRTGTYFSCPGFATGVE